MASVLKIRRLATAEVKAAVALWWVTDVLKPWNDPQADAERALATPTSTILAGLLNDQLVATAMVGSNGHRAGFIIWRCRRVTNDADSEAR